MQRATGQVRSETTTSDERSLPYLALLPQSHLGWAPAYKLPAAQATWAGGDRHSARFYPRRQHIQWPGWGFKATQTSSRSSVHPLAECPDGRGSLRRPQQDGRHKHAR